MKSSIEAPLEILKARDHRDTSVTEDPRTADLFWVSLHHWT